MRHDITFALTGQETSELGFNQLGVQMCKSFLGNIILFCEKTKLPLKKEFLFEEGNLHKSIVGYAKGFTYETLPSIECKLTDFQLDGKAMRLSYILCNGKRESIPVITDFYVSGLWLTLQNHWLRNKKQK